MQGLKKSIEFFSEEKYLDLPYGTVYYVAGTASSEINDFVLTQIESIEERINQDASNWVTCRIVYLDGDNSLFPAQRNAALYSAMLPTDDNLNQGYSFLMATLQNCSPNQMNSAFSIYFRTLQQMFDEILDDGSYDASHLENTVIWDVDDRIRFSIRKDSSERIPMFSVSGDMDFNANFPSTREEESEGEYQQFDQPSRLEITPYTYQILLPDYNREFHFTAQVKALYVLFLNHPEGIRMKDFIDYKAEYTRLYFYFTNRGDVDRLRESVEKLFDVYDTRVLNVKKSQCNKTIRQTIPEKDLRKYYEIEVNRGEEHRINLYRFLVSMPDNLRP